MTNSINLDNKYVVNSLVSFSDKLEKELPSEWEELYKTREGENTWLEENSFVNAFYLTQFESSLFNENLKEIAKYLIHICKQIYSKRNTVGLYRLFGIVAKRNLELLFKLEDLFTVVKDASIIFDLNFKDQKLKGKYGGKPPKDHVIHIANLLIQGTWFLNQKDSNGKLLNTEIFERLKNSWWKNIKNEDINNTIREYGKDQLKMNRFVHDLWLFSVLIHDVGYVSCLKVLLCNIQKNSPFEPVNDIHEKIINWIEEKRKSSREILKENKETDLLNSDLFLPTLSYLFDDASYINEAEKLHGFLSGYIVLDYVLNQKEQGISIFNKLSPHEKLTLLTVCNASIIHTISDKKIKSDMGLLTEQERNKVLLNDPLGMLLYSLDSIQEWNRVMWIHEEGEFASQIVYNGKTKNLEDKGLSWSGLSLFLGQTAIPNCKMKMSDNCLHIFFEERKFTNGIRDYIIEKKYFDFSKLIHNDQKELILFYLLNQFFSFDKIILECALLKMEVNSVGTVTEYKEMCIVDEDRNKWEHGIQYNKGQKRVRIFLDKKIYKIDEYDNKFIL